MAQGKAWVAGARAGRRPCVVVRVVCSRLAPSLEFIPPPLFWTWRAQALNVRNVDTSQRLEMLRPLLEQQEEEGCDGLRIPSAAVVQGVLQVGGGGERRGCGGRAAAGGGGVVGGWGWDPSLLR